MIGTLAHEFGNAMFEHYYGLPHYSLSHADCVAGWMNNEGYAQVNAIRITQDMPRRTNTIKLEGTSDAQVQSEYSAYQTAGQHYETDPTLSERGMDMLV